MRIDTIRGQIQWVLGRMQGRDSMLDIRSRIWMDRMRWGRYRKLDQRLLRGHRRMNSRPEGYESRS
jgi:hypothetical protein